MTYFDFLLSFIAIPLAVLVVYTTHYPNKDKAYILKGVAVLCGLAFVYTTPWDNYLLAKEVWWYGPDRVMFTIGYVPIEEYSFFLLQTILTGLWTHLVLNHSPSLRPAKPDAKTINRFKFIIATAIAGLWIYGIRSLFVEQSFYLGLILAWATPIVLLQFVIGGQHILNNMNSFFLCVITPTLYLWYADLYAINDGIWSISKTYTIGLEFSGLPIEEMIFFLITNIMVVQGLLLFVIMRDTVKTVFNRN